MEIDKHSSLQDERITLTFPVPVMLVDFSKIATVTMTVLIFYTLGVFITLHFLRNLQIGAISWSVTLHKAGKAFKVQTLKLIGQIGYEENEVL